MIVGGEGEDDPHAGNPVAAILAQNASQNAFASGIAADMLGRAAFKAGTAGFMGAENPNGGPEIVGHPDDEVVEEDFWGNPIKPKSEDGPAAGAVAQDIDRGVPAPLQLPSGESIPGIPRSPAMLAMQRGKLGGKQSVHSIPRESVGGAYYARGSSNDPAAGAPAQDMGR